jgi:hypothetical protein
MMIVTCPECGKPRILGEYCGWCDAEQIERGGDRALAGQAGSGVGFKEEKERAPRGRKDSPGQGCEGEEYSSSKDHFKAETEGHIRDEVPSASRKEAEDGRDS